VLAFAAALSLISGALFGVVPAVRSAAASPQHALVAQSRSSAGGASLRTQHLLVIGNLALALVLTAGAGLMLKSVHRLLKVDPGFDPRDVLTVQFSLVGAGVR
jgi:hypothetical protein